MKRKIYKLLSGAKQGLFALALTVFSGTAYSQATYTLNYTGSVQNLSLPAGNYSIAMWGADGGNGTNGTGGKGGYSQGTLTVAAPTTYYIYVGGKGITGAAGATGGWNGGGNLVGSFTSPTVCGTGGGGTDIRTTSNTTYANRIIVAGGGGGGNGYGAYTGNGGNGGGTTGADGASSRTPNYTGGGGTAVAGGTAATGGIAGYSQPGGLGIGGDYTGTLGGSAGGGGYYGGGSGHWGGAGGGGSGYIGGVTGGVTVQFGQPGFVTKPSVATDGMVLISELCGISLTASGSNSLNPSICSGQSLSLTTNGISNYVWSTGNTTNSVIVVSPTITTVYTLSATSPSNCTASKSITVTVNTAGPVLSYTTVPNTSSVCLGQTVSLTAGGAITYTLVGSSGSLTNGQTFTPSATSNYTITGQNGCGTVSAVTTISVSALPVTAVASNTLICAGTPATLTASGATNYTWTASTSGTNTSASYIVNPAASTTYSLYGVTGPCAGATVITISTKALPTLSISASASAICNGDVVNLNVTGNAVTYSWSPGGPGTSISAFPSNTTLYSVTGTNSVNCVTTVQQVIVVNPLPVVNASASNPLVCSGGASTLAASGASTYAWTGGSGATSSVMVVHPTVSETYTVTGTSSLSCSASTVVLVSVYSPTISVTSATTICAGATAVLNAGVADTYSWSNGQSNQNTSVSPTLTTVYTLTASVNNLNGLSCAATNSVQVTVNANPTITATASRTSICVGESTTLTANGAGATGSYTFTGGTGSVASSTSAVNPIADQTYTVTGIDANGCKGKGTYNLVVAQCVGIAVNSANTANLSVYPNPSAGELTISSDQAITLQIINELGQNVKTIVLDKNTTDVKVNNLPNGIYFISGKNENGSVKQKLIIAK